MKNFLPLGFLLFSFSIQALTLKEKKHLNNWRESILNSDSHQAVIEKCGKAIPLTIDEDMTKTFVEALVPAPSHCESLREAIASICEAKAKKEALLKKIKSVHCKLGEKEKISFKLSGTTLEASVGLHSRVQYDTEQWLEKNL